MDCGHTKPSRWLCNKGFALVATTCQGPFTFNFQFSIFNCGTVLACEPRAKPLFTFKLSHRVSSARIMDCGHTKPSRWLCNKGFALVATTCQVPFTFNLQFSIVERFSSANLEPSAFHFQSSILNFQLRNGSRLRTSCQAAIHFQIIAPRLVCELRAKCFSLSIFNSQFSIFNFQLSNRCAPANSVPSHSSLRVEPLFTFKLSRRVSPANSVPSAFHSQFSILN
jgi:hypothetical protein